MQLVGSPMGSGLLFETLPNEGATSGLQSFALLPLHLAALVWVLPRMQCAELRHTQGTKHDRNTYSGRTPPCRLEASSQRWIGSGREQR